MDRPTSGGKAGLIKIGAAIAVLAAGLFGYQQWARHAAHTQAAQHDADVIDRTAEAWDLYSRCLLGAPLAAGERASHRFRNIVLAAPPATDGQPAWPERCDRHREALELALRGVEGGKLSPLIRLRDINLSFPHPRRDSPGKSLRGLDDLWTAAGDAGLPARSGGEVPLPPAPAHSYPEGALKAVNPVGSVLDERQVGPDTLDVNGSARICRFAVTGDAITARCLPVKKPDDSSLAELQPNLLFSTRADQPPLLSLYGEVAGEKRGALILAWDGTLIHKAVIDDASARGGGAYDVLVNDRGISLTTLREGRPPQQIKVGDGRTAKLIDDWVLRISDAGKLYAARIADAGLGEPVELGPFTRRPTHIHYYCSLADGTRVIQVLSDGRNLVFLKDGVWSAPRAEPGVSGRYVCADDTVSMAWSSWPKGGVRSVHRATCTVDACQRSEAPFPAAADDRSFMHVLPVGDQVLAAMFHPDDGGLRYRLATVEQMASAQEVIVHDKSAYGGPIVRDLELYSLGGRALVLYGSLDGLHGLEIGADGAMKPVAPAAE